MTAFLLCGVVFVAAGVALTWLVGRVVLGSVDMRVTTREGLLMTALLAVLVVAGVLMYAQSG
jgi:hypothetical protein